jgi:hypothetical protein
MDGMKRSNKLYEEVRLEVVREALSGIKVGVIARKYNLHPETVRSWIRLYRDQVDIHELPPADQQFQELKRLPNQLWQADIKYGYVAGRDRFFFVFSIIDVFDRVIANYYRGPVCEG